MNQYVEWENGLKYSPEIRYVEPASISERTSAPGFPTSKKVRRAPTCCPVHLDKGRNRHRFDSSCFVSAQVVLPGVVVYGEFQQGGCALPSGLVASGD